MNYPQPKFLSQDEFHFRLKALPTHTYEQLPALLNLSPEWWGRYLQNPQSMKYGPLLSLAEVLDVHPYELLKTYGVGAQSLNALECMALRMSYEPEPAQ